MKNFLIFAFIALFSFNFSVAHEPIEQINMFDNMPILKSKGHNLHGYAPIEQRDEQFRKFLSPSVKIYVRDEKKSTKDIEVGSKGSGTIIYHDPIKNIAYVASCGHLWDKGVMNVNQGKKMKCKVTVYYHNNLKLDTPKTYDANLIFYSYVNSSDTSLITFTPDWTPNYFPIAPMNYQYKIGSRAHSCGCDHGTEAAHYDVKIKEAGADVITEENSPRPGRSGGGLMDDNGYYIGTCWGTEFEDGSGVGVFTTLSDIHTFWGKQKGYEFLLNQKPKKTAAQLIKIKDVNKEVFYSPEYILLP